MAQNWKRKEIITSGTTAVTYYGYTQYPLVESDKQWFIEKETTITNGVSVLTTITIPSGTTAYSYSWTDRAIYGYW